MGDRSPPLGVPPQYITDKVLDMWPYKPSKSPADFHR